MNLIWPWMLGLLLPVGFVALWALRHSRRRQVAVPSVTLWQVAADHAGRADTAPGNRVRLSWFCLLLGAVLAVLAATEPVANLRPERHQVTFVIAGDLDRHDFENTAAAMLGRLSPRDRIQLLYPLSLPEGNAPAGWLTPSQAQQVIRTVPLVPAPAVECRFVATDTDPALMFVFAPAGALDAIPLNGQLIACRSTMPPIVCRHAGTYVQDDDTMDVFVVLANDSDGPIDIDVSRWEGDTAEDVRRRDSNYQPMGQRRIEPGASEVITFETSYPLASVRWRSADGAFEGDVCLTAADRPRTRVFLNDDMPAMLVRLVETHPDWQRVASPEEADVSMAFAGRDNGTGPKITFVPSPSHPRGSVASDTGRSLTRGPATLGDARVDYNSPIMAEAELSSVAIRDVPDNAVVGDHYRILLSIDGQALLVLDLRYDEPMLHVLFDISPENTNWTADESFVVFMTNAVAVMTPAPTPDAAYTLPADAPADWITQWQPLDRLRLGGLHLWPPEGFWQDGQGVIHAVSKVGFSGSEPEVRAIDVVKELVLPEPTVQVVRYQIGAILAAVAGVLWLTGWVLATEGR